MRFNKTIVAILAITGLVALALFKGVDGAIFSIAITAIAGLGGYALKASQKAKK